MNALHLIKKGPSTPTPGLTQAHPWRFTRGQAVYLAGHNQTTSFEVVGGELHNGFPHLLVVDYAGETWRVPQLTAASKPINLR